MVSGESPHPPQRWYRIDYLGACREQQSRQGCSGIFSWGDRILAEFPANSLSARTPAAHIWRKTLSQIPTVFGRLVFVASLRDTGTGKYSHEALVRLLSQEDTDRTLCNSHHQVFSEWLGFSLSEQKSDLDDYLNVAGSPRDALHYRDLVPPTARDVERQLYLTDLETLLELLKYEHGGAFLIPGA
jgi:hypothetical protein